MVAASPDSPASADGLGRILAAEAECVGAFVVLLENEQAALADGRVEALPELTEHKNDLALRLAALAKARNARLAGEGCSGDRQGVERWAVRHPDDKGLAEAWTQLSALATRARELNRVNGELIALRMQYNARALEALRGGDRALDLYGPDGQATGSSGRRINDAV